MSMAYGTHIVMMALKSFLLSPLRLACYRRLLRCGASTVLGRARLDQYRVWALGCGMLLVLPVSSAVTALETLANDVEVRHFVDEMVIQHGFDRPQLMDLFAEARLLPHVLRAMSRPAEAKPWFQYRSIFLTPGRIRGGLAFWQRHGETLERARTRFGVDPEIIVAIIGVETLYGQRTGRYRVLDSLTTLAFHYPKRSSFFRSELAQFLLLTREEGLDPLTLNGSYAGAIGLPQFISSSYRRYAVDFNDDQVRDLIRDPEDAIGSVGNYLQHHGWQRDKAIVLAASIEHDEVRALLNAGIQPHTRLVELKSRGVKMSGKVPDKEKGALIELETEDGHEHWVGLQNFYTITRYNHSALYAMAVYQLAQAIREQFVAANRSY